MKNLDQPIRRDLKDAGLLPELGDTEVPGDDRRGDALSSAEAAFLSEGGWHVIDPIRGGQDFQRHGGLTAHRGLLQPDEFVDHELLVRRVEEELSFSFDQVHQVYKPGKRGVLPRELHALRDRLDARILELHEAGTNISLLSEVLGLSSEIIYRALARARGVN